MQKKMVQYLYDQRMVKILQYQNWTLSGSNVDLGNQKRNFRRSTPQSYHANMTTLDFIFPEETFFPGRYLSKKDIFVGMEAKFIFWKFSAFPSVIMNGGANVLCI